MTKTKAKAKAKAKASVVRPDRPGEGALLKATVTPDAETSGSTSYSIAIEMNAAPVPERKYVADYCSVVNFGEDIRLLFGQMRLDGGGLRSLLVIHLSSEGAGRMLMSFDKMKNPTLDEVMADRASDIIEASPPPDKEPEQTIAFSANFIMSGFTGNESCIDFFQASPFSVLAIPNSKKIALDPVVRVEITTTKLLGLLVELRSRVPKLELFESQEELL